MTNPCDNVHLFADGELDAAAAEEFRAHLPGCARCQSELHATLQLDALLTPRAEPRVEAPRTRPAPIRRRRALVAAAVVIPLAAAATVAFVVTRGGTPPRASSALVLAPRRGIAVRVTHPPADRYREYDAPRAGGVLREEITLDTLAALERAGDRRALAAAHLLRGDLVAAEAALEGSEGADAESDRAAIELVAERPAAALARTTAVLEETAHAQARWNRALALEALGLPRAAAAAWDTASSDTDPGWAEEARRRAEALRGAADRRQEEAERVNAAGREMVDGGPPITSDQARARPGVARLWLYDAVRSAETRERALALAPLAAELDRIAGGTVLSRYVERIAAASFARRAPLARRYRALALGAPLSPAERDLLLRDLDRAGEHDLLLGALLHTRAVRQDLDRYRRLAAETEDPWFAAIAAHEQARAAIARHDLLDAERDLTEAARVCESAGIEYRCMQLLLELATLEKDLHRIVSARRHALAGWEMARRGNEWRQEVQLLRLLAQIAFFEQDLALLEGFLEEAERWAGDDCASRRYTQVELASAHLFAMRFDRARRAIDAMPRCDLPLLLQAGIVYADLARHDGTPEETRRLLDDLAGLRAGATLDPGQRAMADYVEGRLLAARDPAQAEVPLRRAIAAAGALPAWDGEARRARAYSYSTLIMMAGARGDLSGALALFAEEVGAPPPGPCTLGVAVDDERVLAVATGPDGVIRGRFRSDRRNASLDPASVVPDDLRAVLTPCPTVSVLARPPLHGRPDLLPPTMAWRFTGAQREAARVRGARRLVVSDVTQPAGLGLPPLRHWDTPTGTEVVHLRGAEATPARVLAEIGSAAIVEIHAHGLVNVPVSDASVLVLSPDASARFTLTAADVQASSFPSRPVVLLGACHIAETAPYLHEAWSLPVAFLNAGASAVIASSAVVSDAEAAVVFDELVSRIRGGEPPAEALRNVRAPLLDRDPSSWTRSLMVFE